MAGSDDILQRVASRLGIRAEELVPYMDAMLAICGDALRDGECVELMTFGTLCPAPERDAFQAHPSLLAAAPPGDAR